jgi:carbon storage regulator CsrA
MLVLTRKEDEKITIRCPDGSFISIIICRIDDNRKVRIGIDADNRYKITRTELIKRSNQTETEFFKKYE